MLLSLALIFLCGIGLGKVFELLKLPSLLGMLITGIILGPYALNLLDPSLLGISPQLRQIALIIILSRAGMNLNISDLKKVGRPAILLCFIPACFEIAGMMLLAPRFFGISLLESAVMGTVIAAVSPAVIVPRMIKLIETGYGTDKAIPQMIMASASVDDVFVIVLFTAFSGLLQSGKMEAAVFLSIPTSILLGMLGGGAAGLLLAVFFAKVHMRDSAKIVVLLAISFLLVTLEQQLTGPVGFSGLLAVMAMGVAMRIKRENVSKRLSSKFSKLWVAAEIWLFVLVGAAVNIDYALKAGFAAVLLIICVLVLRIGGVFVCLWGTKLNQKERTFTAFSYIPKATVQAAIGGLPLAMGLACGNIVLTVAVLSILMTAPLGALLIDRTFQKYLTRNNQ